MECSHAWRLVGLAVIALFSLPIYGQSADSLEAVTLSEVTIQALGGPGTMATSPIAHGKLSTVQLQEAASTTLVPALNSLPGVRLEERAPSSYRVAIRGSSIRAPFGVRNVKIYWNGIPLTEPNNTTPLNLLDLGNVDHIEVLKGPASSNFGAGTGGVINLQSEPAAKGLGLQAAYTLRSFGTHHARLRAEYGTDKFGIQLRANHLQSEGYRNHAATHRWVGQASAHFRPSKTSTFLATILLSDLHYQIPGGLTKDQWMENPQQARFRSAEQNSSVDHRRAFLGLGYLQAWASVSWRTYAYGSIGRFDNPFILDYKQEQNQGIGVRSTLDVEVSDAFIIKAGLELQRSFDLAENYGNVGGVADTLRFADEIDTRQGFGFLAAHWEPNDRWLVDGGLSINLYQYQVNRRASSFTPLDTGRFVRDFLPVTAPRLGISYRWRHNHVLFLNLSRGFSPPTLDEVRTNEGSLNADLQAEDGTNMELGYRWLKDGQKRLSANLFWFQLNQTITTFTNEDGVVLFQNAGATRQFGLEISGTEQVHLWRGAKIKYHYAYTGHFFRFLDYTKREQDFSGNALPGVAPHTLSHQLTWHFSPNTWLHLRHLWSDAIPLNDENTVFAHPYHWVQLRQTYRWVQPGFVIDLFAGIDNLLNQQFSLGNDLNPFGGRFYQPAPGRNFLVGIVVDLQKSN